MGETPEQVRELAPGVIEVETQTHGGMILSEERWTSLPEEIREAMLNPGFAEEDCEANIVLAILGLADQGARDAALLSLEMFSRYAPALKYIQ